MRIVVDGKSYGVTLEQNALGESVTAMCPMKLTLSRSGEHKYYAALPNKAKIVLPKSTNPQRIAGNLNYFGMAENFV